MICMSSLYAPVPLRLRRFGGWRCWCHRGWRRSHRGRCRCCMSGRGMSRRRSWHDHARCLRARRAACKWQQRDVARPLDGHAQPALMPRAHARHPPRQNLPALLHELRQDVRALVVDEVHLLDAELAHLLLPEILALAPWPASGTSRTAAWSAFAPRTTVPAARTAVTTTMAAFTPRSSAGRWCLFLFLCHTFHPFTHRPGKAGVNLLVIPVEPESLFLDSKKLFRLADLAAGRGLLRRCRRWGGGRRRAARAPRGALLALHRKFLLALQIFVQPHGLIFDHRVLHAQTPLQFGNQFAVVRADFLVNVDAFAVLRHAIDQLSGAPVLRLLDLAALFRDSVLDDREDFFDIFFRRRRPHNENQIVVTLFHDDLFPFTPGAQPGKIVLTFLPALPDRLVSAGCTSSSPRRCPDSGSFRRRPRLRRSFPPLLPAPISSSAAARILCGCSTDDPVRNPAAAL